MAFFPVGCRALLESWRTGKFLSWHVSQPNTGGSGEYSANGAARLPITFATSSDANSGDATNQGALESAAASAPWTRITHVGISTAQTGGAFHVWARLGTAVSVGLGEKIRLPAGDLDISIPVS